METSPAQEALARYTIRELLMMAELARVPGRSKLTKDRLILELLQRGYRPRGDPGDPSARRAIEARLLSLVNKLTVARLSTAERLTISPIEGASFDDRAIPLFEEIEAGTIAVEELHDGASVPELLVTKTSDGRTILLEGEPLVGGKQDRVLRACQGIKVPIRGTSCYDHLAWAGGMRQRYGSDTRLFGLF